MSLVYLREGRTWSLGTKAEAEEASMGGEWPETLVGRGAHCVLVAAGKGYLA